MTIHEELKVFEPKDIHEQNEVNQLLTATVLYEFFEEPIPEAVAEEIRERLEYLIEGKVHPKRVDIT